MSAETGRKAEIEITPAMLQVGAARILGFDPRFEDARDVALEAFLAMYDLMAREASVAKAQSSPPDEAPR